MKYIVETSVDNFEFWSGARQVADRINERSDARKLWNIFEYYVEECEREGMEVTDTFINDLLWFESDNIFGFDVFDDEAEDDDEDNEDDEN